MYYWLQNDVRPQMAGRLTGTVDCAASHPGSATQYIPLPSRSPQTRRVGLGQERAALAALPLRCLRLRSLLRITADLCGLEYDAVHGNSALILSIVICKINTVTRRCLDGNFR